MKNQSSGNPKTARSSLVRGLSGAVVVVGYLVVAAGCSTPEQHAFSDQKPQSTGSVLRVGVTPDYPPLVFDEGEYVAGAEVDLAQSLGKALHRPVEFLTLKRDDQLNALNDGRADIIMSGVSVTPARKLRAVFTDPYLTNQLRCVFRRTDAYKFQTVDDVLSTQSRVGVLPGTTADIFVQKHCPDAQRIPMQNRRDVVFYLTDGARIDLYIDDIFALAQMVSQHEASLAYLPDALDVEDLAWAVAPSNTQLRDQVNQILAHWKADGSLDATLQRWMPYLKKH
jgi:ABC-type amino acid transport substrate-binding protein